MSESFIFCKKCCKTECPPCCRDTDCRQRLRIESKISTIDVKFNSSSELSVTNDDDSETETFLQAINETNSWIKALQHCRHLNSTLVQITDETVGYELLSLLEENEALQNGSWIGLERSIFGTNLEWKWTSGIKADYSDWNSSFSVDPLNNHCGKIVWLEDSDDFQLLDGNCHEKLPFICQRQP
ncbi:PREDICTED: dromaiocalcin-2-like [Cyprinodon variegatus]|uniref:dromaiocalcin-2-like n=1 Tax=Cyprinodon variegatus TaxID=28743 RepID=UPI0007429B73|nr:PREDICTED: dromaiocalcin-2-like [Cyprinodon variegatus]